VDPVGLHPPLFVFKKKAKKVRICLRQLYRHKLNIDIRENSVRRLLSDM
jgi:hypothetical protein